MSLRTLRHPHNKSDNLAPAQFGSKHLMMKKYFLPDLYCKQFEMIVIIWCLCAVLRLYRREKCCQTTFWMDFLLNVGAELSGCQYVWSQIVHCLISWCKFVCLSFWCHFFLFSLSNLSRCLIVRLPNCLVPNCPSTKTSPHLKKKFEDTYLAYSPVPFCQSQGEDLAPTRSNKANDIAIVVATVAIDVTIPNDAANSRSTWIGSSITFPHTSQLPGFKCLLSNPFGIHPSNPYLGGHFCTVLGWL